MDVWIHDRFVDSPWICGLTMDSWIQDGFLDSRQVSGFGIRWESGNIQKHPNTYICRLSECKSVLPEMFARSELVGEKNLALFGQLQMILSTVQQIQKHISVCLFSLVVQWGLFTEFWAVSEKPQLIVEVSAHGKGVPATKMDEWKQGRNREPENYVTCISEKEMDQREVTLN